MSRSDHRPQRILLHLHAAISVGTTHQLTLMRKAYYLYVARPLAALGVQLASHMWSSTTTLEGLGVASLNAFVLRMLKSWHRYRERASNSKPYVSMIWTRIQQENSLFTSCTLQDSMVATQHSLQHRTCWLAFRLYTYMHVHHG